MTNVTCTLCNTHVRSHSIQDGSCSFCCHGCHAVYNILVTTHQLEHYQDSPIFKQAVQSGLISNPDLLEQIRSYQIDINPQEMQKLYLEIGEMWCPSCAELIRLMLLRKRGITKCIIDYATDLAVIEYSPRYISKEEILSTISSLGYQPAPLQGERKPVSFALKLRFVISAFFTLNVMMLSYPLYATYFDRTATDYSFLIARISAVASLPVLLYGGWPIIRRFWSSLKVGILGMESLVVLAVGSAFTLSLYHLFQGIPHVYFDSMSVIITFMLLGKMIESRAKFSAKSSLIRLTHALPRRGRKQFPTGEEQFVPLKEIELEDLIVVRTGERIVLDGVVVEGAGAADESVMTGESVPVSKEIGSMVMSGTILVQGWLVFRVTATPEASALQRVIDMVEQDIGHKTAYVRAADQVVKWFAPVVVLIAVGAGFLVSAQGLEVAILRAISILLISCPCAIGIAAPLAESILINRMAELGVIVRNRGCLALLGRETVFVSDKTGTMTDGKFHVQNVIESPVLKALAEKSTHPIAQAIAASIRGPSGKISKLTEIAGRGIRAEFEDRLVLLGSRQFLEELGIQVQEPASTYFMDQKIYPIHLDDEIREGASELVRSMNGVKTLLLSGDHPRRVEQVAKVCGFDDWKAECSPLEKRQVVDGLREKGEIVCMLGDGINDAPALTGAHIGISVVSATDISIQVSDLLLTSDRLDVVSRIRSLARKGQRIVKQNLFWAFFYNVVGVVLAVFGLLTPLYAAGAMIVSSLIVIGNARRLR